IRYSAPPGRPLPPDASSRGTGRSSRRLGRPQPGGATQPAGVAVARWQQSRDHRVGKDERTPAARHFVVERGDAGKGAAEHDRLGVEDVDDSGQGSRQPAGVALDRVTAGAVASGGRSDDAGAVEFAAAMAAMVGGETGARQKGLDAAAAAAIALWPRRFVGLRRRQRIVAPFAGDRIDADDEAPADDHAAADPGAEDHAEDAAAAGGGARAPSPQ